ncbi:Uncharacterised protein [Vibrio cholerae]|nr:Uncharacterised protein [Vibrio cholerae]
MRMTFARCIASQHCAAGSRNKQPNNKKAT